MMKKVMKTLLALAMAFVCGGAWAQTLVFDKYLTSEYQDTGWIVQDADALTKMVYVGQMAGGNVNAGKPLNSYGFYPTKQSDGTVTFEMQVKNNELKSVLVRMKIDNATGTVHIKGDLAGYRANNDQNSLGTKSYLADGSARASGTSNATLGTAVNAADSYAVGMIIARSPATPVAIWEGDFNKTTKGDYTLALNGNTKATDNSTITITGNNGGVKISGSVIYTVLVKAKNYNPSQTDKTECVLSMLSGNTEYVGVGARSDKYAYGIWSGNQWSNNSGVPYKSSSVGYANSNDGNAHTYALSYASYETGAASKGTKFYYDGEEAMFFSGLRADALRVATGVIIGGRAQSTTSSLADASSMVIEGIAIFGAEASKEDIKNFVWPSEKRDELNKSPACWFEFERNLNFTGANRDFSSNWPEGEAGFSFVPADNGGYAYGVIDGSCHPYCSIANGKMGSQYTVVSRVRSVSVDKSVFWALGHSTDDGNTTLGLMSRGVDKVALFESSGSSLSVLIDNIAVVGAVREFHDYAVTVDGNSVSLYVDGEKKGNTVTKSYTPSAHLQIGAIKGGVNNPGLKRTTGLALDDWRFYSEVLSANDIKTIADSRIVGYAYPEVISVNFNAKAFNNGTSDGNDSHKIGDDEGTATLLGGSVPGGSWNQDTENGYNSATERSFAAGTVKTHNLVSGSRILDAVVVTHKGKNTYRWQDAWAKYLRGYLDDGGQGDNYGPRATFTNIPYKKYDVVVYSATDSSSKYYYPVEINDRKYIGGDDKTMFATGDDIRWGWSNAKSAQFGRNAMKVTGLSGTLTIKALPGNSGNGYRNGITAIQVAPQNHVIIPSADASVDWPKGLTYGTCYIYAPYSGTVTIDENLSCHIDNLIVYGSGSVKLIVNGSQKIAAIDATDLSGKLSVATDNSVSASAAITAGNGGLDFEYNGNTAVKPTIACSGILTKLGTGTLELTTATTPSEIIVEAGVLKQPQDASNWDFGTANAQRTITVKSGAQVDLNGCRGTPINYDLAGSGPNNTGAVIMSRNSGNSNTVCCGDLISLSDDATINVDKRWCWIAPSHRDHVVNLNNHKLTKIGNGDLVIDEVTINGGGSNGEFIIAGGTMKANAWLGEGGGGHFWDAVNCTLTVKSTGDLSVNSKLPVKNLNLEKVIGIGSGVDVHGELTLVGAFTGNGCLTLHDSTKLSLPAGVAFDQPFTLCSDGSASIAVESQYVGPTTVKIGGEAKENVYLYYLASNKSVTVLENLTAEYTLSADERSAVEAANIPQGGYHTLTISQTVAPHATITNLPAGLFGWAVGGNKVYVVHKSNSISVKTGRRSDTEGYISDTQSAGAVEIPGILWNYTYTSNQNNADNGYYNDILQPIDGNGALSSAKFAFYARNTYFTQNSNYSENGNSQLTRTYIDDGEESHTDVWTVKDRDFIFDDVTLPQPLNNRGWQLRVSDIPYEMYDLYIYVASDVGNPGNSNLKATAMALSVNGGTNWKWYAGDPVNHATIASEASNTWKADPYSTGTLTEGTNYIKIRVSKSAFEADDISTIDICHGVRNTSTDTRSSLAAVQIVEVASDGIYNRKADVEGKENWTAEEMWTLSNGTTTEWPTSADMVLANIDGDQTTSIKVDDVINANMVTLRNTAAEEGQSPKSFKFLTVEDLSEVATEKDAAHELYILKSPVDATDFNGDLYLQSRIKGTVTLGTNTRVVFVAGDEGDPSQSGVETTAYPYEFAGSSAAIRKVGYGTFIVPSSIYGRGFIVDEGTIRYDYSGESAMTLSAAISGSGKIEKKGTGTLILGAENSVAGLDIVNGTIKAGANGALGTGTIKVGNGATLDLNAKPAISDGYELELNGGTVLCSGNSTFYNRTVTLSRSLSLGADSTISRFSFGVGVNDASVNAPLSLDEYSLTLDIPNEDVEGANSNWNFFLNNATVTGTGSLKLGAHARVVSYNTVDVQAPVELAQASRIVVEGGSLKLKDIKATGGAEINGGNGYTTTIADGSIIELSSGSLTFNTQVAFEGAIKVKGVANGETLFTLGENITAPTTFPTIKIITDEGETASGLYLDGREVKVGYYAAIYNGTRYETVAAAIDAIGDASSAITLLHSDIETPNGWVRDTAENGTITIRKGNSKIVWDSNNSGDWDSKTSTAHKFTLGDGTITHYTDGDTVVFVNNVQMWAKSATYGVNYQIGDAGHTGVKVTFSRSGSGCGNYILDGSSIVVTSGNILAIARYSEAEGWDSYQTSAGGYVGSELNDTSISGAGKVEIMSDVTAKLLGTSDITAQLSGVGKIKYAGFAAVSNAVKTSLQDSEHWTGTLVITQPASGQIGNGDNTVDTADNGYRTLLNNYGNINSKIEFVDCTGDGDINYIGLSHNGSSEPVVIQPEIVITGNVKLNNGYSHSSSYSNYYTIIRKLSGTGAITATHASQLYYIGDGSGFEGSISTTTKKFIFGERESTDGVPADGIIAVKVGKSVTIASDKTWSGTSIVVNGTLTKSNGATLTGSNNNNGKVSGSGEIIIVGSDSAAGISGHGIRGLTETNWTGTLTIKDWNGAANAGSADFGNLGNANSTVRFDGYNGYLYMGTYNQIKAYDIAAGGLTLIGQYSNGNPIFQGNLTGSGPIAVNATGGRLIKFVGDHSGYTGTITVANTACVALVDSADASVEYEAGKVIYGSGSSQKIPQIPEGTTVTVAPGSNATVTFPEEATPEQKAAIAEQIVVKYGNTVLNQAEGTKYVEVTINQESGKVELTTTDSAKPAATAIAMSTPTEGEGESATDKVQFTITNPIPGLFYAVSSCDEPNGDFTSATGDQATSAEAKTVSIPMEFSDGKKVKYYKVSVKATK